MRNLFLIQRKIWRRKDQIFVHKMSGRGWKLCTKRGRNCFLLSLIASIFPLILALWDKLKDVKIHSPHFLLLLFRSLQLICHNTLQSTASKEIISWQGSPEETMGLTGLPPSHYTRKTPSLSLHKKTQNRKSLGGWMD